jgi:hypothetical protein
MSTKEFMIVTREDAAAVEAYAKAHWGENGWDMVYECMDMQSLQELATRNNCVNYISLFTEVTAEAKLWSEMQSDICGWGGAHDDI